jgi:hypothetical protein
MVRFQFSKIISPKSERATHPPHSAVRVGTGRVPFKGLAMGDSDQNENYVGRIKDAVAVADMKKK